LIQLNALLSRRGALLYAMWRKTKLRLNYFDWAGIVVILASIALVVWIVVTVIIPGR
jgi:hypothetical protein